VGVENFGQAEGVEGFVVGLKESEEPIEAG
jgi:hypothetical protein